VAHSWAQDANCIREGILKAGDELHARHPWLEKHQNAIGVGIFLVCYLAILATDFAYPAGAIAWYGVIPLATTSTSTTTRSRARSPTWKSAASPTACPGA
jgi:hypothetical protein